MNASFELESYTYADYILPLLYPITRYNKSTRFGITLHFVLIGPTRFVYHFRYLIFNQPDIIYHLKISLNADV